MRSAVQGEGVGLTWQRKENLASNQRFNGATGYEIGTTASCSRGSGNVGGKVNTDTTQQGEQDGLAAWK